jgi:hypothetical protein
MKLVGTVHVFVSGEEVLRQPRFWDKVVRAFGGEPDMRTGQARSSLEASAVVEGVRDALRRMGVNNAVSLIIDDVVLFHDKERRPDDLGDLFLAFHDNAVALGGGFRMLRLAVEHTEAMLHLVVEVQARTEHPVGAPAVRVLVSGRIGELEPRPGESAEGYRARVEPLTRDRGAIDAARAQLESFVVRVRDAIQTAMPEARAEVVAAEARVQRPTEPRRDERRPDPEAAGYDPYDNYYGGGPMHMMLNVMMWSSLFSMMHHPQVVVVNEHGEPEGHADDPGMEHGDGGDHADADMGGGDDFGGDDFGGDFGGGDFGDFGGDF